MAGKLQYGTAFGGSKVRLCISHSGMFIIEYVLLG